MSQPFSQPAGPLGDVGHVPSRGLRVYPAAPQPPEEAVPHRLPPEQKLVTLEQLDEILHLWREAGGCVVMTNGCFDLLHPGHVAALQQARKLGDCLVVGLNSDRSVRELKGPGRPIVDQQGRAAMLTALECVDYVVIFDDVQVGGLVERVLPDVLVKSAEYAVDQVVGAHIVQRHGGNVVLVPMIADYSTSDLLRRVGEVARRRWHNR
jgi:D-beta-D-heptose 7-phosphate kinase/D-beta-D-heptose 1-phosphate adenosyltransferase